ncbi:MAG: hypothetical protein KatS3mg045_0360 [Bellilinea sp.]|nr:MAG: hypothetical protein KatS3mg045_0360 [Bellilinea sp.]
MLDHLRLDKGSTTCVLGAAGGSPALIGQVRYESGQTARLSFILPAQAAPPERLTALLEGLVRQAGAHGSQVVLAEVEERSPLFEALRRTGFGVFTWQRIWRVLSLPGGESTAPWELASELDHLAVRNLVQTLIPPLVQSAEAFPHALSESWVLFQQQEILGYAAPVFGPRGIVVQPILHPAVEDVAAALRGLIAAMPFVLGRPVYVVVRAYQSYLENGLEQLGAERGERQAVLVKHLTSLQRKVVFAARNGTLEKHQPALVEPIGGETPLPLVQYEYRE